MKFKDLFLTLACCACVASCFVASLKANAAMQLAEEAIMIADDAMDEAMIAQSKTMTTRSLMKKLEEKL